MRTRSISPTLLVLLLTIAALVITAPVLLHAATPVLTLDGAGTGRPFEGQGAMSAGNSSRLLIDYPEPYRSQILDYLFKPNYGASFQDLKIEIGGDMNSTAGSEPSHMHNRSDQDYNRGFQWWLMKEAKKRNPNITLSTLAWGAPGWVGNGRFFSQDTIDYIVNYIQGAKAYHNLTIDYVGILNERPYDIYWIIQLKAALRAWNLPTKIVAADMSGYSIVTDMLANPALMDAVDVVGFHYPRFDGGLIPVNKPIWGSEEGLAWDWNGNWTGAAYLAKAYNRPYIRSRITKHQVWSLVTSYYDLLLFPGSGQMYANTPWSGNYTVQPAIWASAHTNQFAGPGWQYVDNSSGFFGSGSYVTVKKESDFSVIIENVDGAEAPLTFNIVNGLSTGPLHVWKSDQDQQFIRQPDIIPVNGSFSLTVASRSIYSITTTTGQSKGDAVPPPPAPFPFPYADDFENVPLSGQAKYFSDLNGSFEAVNCGGGRSGLCLRQAAPAPPIAWSTIGPLQPSSLMGSANWTNYQVSTDVFFEQPATVKLMGRVMGMNVNNGEMYGYQVYLDQAGNWSLRQGNFVNLANGSAGFSGSAWHNLKMIFDGGRIRVVIDDVTVVDRATDGTFFRGMVGIGVQTWTTAQFDNFRIDPIPGAGFPVPPSTISVTASGETQGYEASKAIDGDNRTFWNSPFTCVGGCRVLEPLPQSLTLALGKTYQVQRVRYLPRQDNNLSGTITSYNIYVSSDGTNFTKVAAGNWANNASEKSAAFTAVSASYVKLEAISATGGLAAASEVNVEYDPSGPTVNPTPTISSFAPNSAIAGNGSFVMSISGSNFVPGSVVRWNGADRTTIYNNSTKLTVNISSEDIAEEGTAGISVLNPSPGGGVSAVKAFLIQAAGSVPPLPPAISFLTNGPAAGTSQRNDFTGWAGMQITVGSSPLSVTSLGRFCLSGNAGSHVVKFVNANNGTDVDGASVTVSMSGCAPGRFVYEPTAIPIMLLANRKYFLVSRESQNGDKWFDRALISPTNSATVDAPIYQTGSSGWTIAGGANSSYVPPSFQYSIESASTQYLLTISVAPSNSGTISINPAMPGNLYNSGSIVQITATGAPGCTFTNWTGGVTTNPLSVTMNSTQAVTANFDCPSPSTEGKVFVSGYSSSATLRNDFTGWVGMEIAVGTKPLSVTALGRICVWGNTGTHVVKFINQSTSADVPGASASLNMNGCSQGEFVYAALPNPVVLSAGARYFLASQEFQGGDRWYGLAPIVATSDATVVAGIYQQSSSGWLRIGGPNSSYVPPTFRYTSASAAPITVTIQSDPSGNKFSVDGVEYSTAQTFSWKSGDSHTVAAGPPQILVPGSRIGWSSWSDGGAQSHTITPTANATFTAYFKTQHQLTSNVWPAGAGIITANPPSPSGYYDAGTDVQVTPTPAANCSFTHWSGGGTETLRSILMTGVQLTEANFTCGAPPASSASAIVTGFNPNAQLRNDFSGWVGMNITMKVTVNLVSLGRICVSGNSKAHTVKIVKAVDGFDLAEASTIVNMAGCVPGQFVYAPLDSPVTLSAGTRYYLVTEETQGGDRWHDRTVVTTTSAAGLNGTVFSIGPSRWTGANDAMSYAPPSFQYIPGP